MSHKKQPKPRGFAAMSLEQRKELSSRGGKKSQESGKANKFDSDKGREAQALRKDRRKDEKV